MYEQRELSFKKLAIASLLIGGIVLLAWVWPVLEGLVANYLPMNNQTYEYPATFYNTVASGDLVQAGREAQDLLSSDAHLSPVDESWARIAIVDAYVENATSSVAYAAAIGSALSNYHAVSDAFTRAWILNRVLGILSDTDQNTLSTIFSNDPELSPLLASNSGKTAQNVAAYSYAIYPTSASAYYLAGVDAEKIIASYNANSQAVISAKDTATAKADLISWLNKGDMARTIEMQYASSSPYGPASYISLTNLYRSYSIGALALIDSSYQADADATFQSIYDAYSSSRDQKGEPYPQLVETAADAHFSQASFLYLSGSYAHKAEIENNLQQSIHLVDQYPAYTQKFRAAFADKNKKSASYVSMVTGMAAISPEFKVFLTSQGWNFGK